MSYEFHLPGPRQDKPRTVNFGISNSNRAREVSNVGDNVVVDMAFLYSIERSGEGATTKERATAVRDVMSDGRVRPIRGGKEPGDDDEEAATAVTSNIEKKWFGQFGGQVIPKTLSEVLRDIGECYC